MQEWFAALIRFADSILVLVFLSHVVAAFRLLTLASAATTALLIAIAGGIAEHLAGRGLSPYRRGIIGFIVSTIIIYATQLFSGFTISILAALLAGFLIGIVDMFVPTSIRFKG